MKQKILVAALALMLVLCLTLGATLAWLTARTQSITNVFTTVGITLTLTETYNTDANSDETNDSWTAKMYPGTTYAKDPIVTVGKDSEACWVFVKIDDTANKFEDDVDGDENNVDKIIEWTIDASNWTPLDGVDGVYYKAVTDTTKDTRLQVLAGEGEGNLANGKVTISNYLTNDNMPAANISIVITAYAVQYEGFSTAAAAWEVAKELPNS